MSRLARPLRAAAAPVLIAGFLGVASPPSLAASGAAAAASSSAERLAALLERIEEAQRELGTLRADFEQRRESRLLLEPEIATGTFEYRADEDDPAARWEFITPDDMLVVVRGGEVLTWYRDLGRAERLRVGDRGEQVLQLFGAGASLTTLRRYFDLTVRTPADPEAPYRLELEPRFSRVAKRIAALTIDLERRRLVPVYLRYEEPGGDATELRFSAIELDAELSPERFDIELPADVEVTSRDLGG